MGVFHDFQPAFADSTCTQGVHDVSQAIDMQSPGYPDRDNHGDGPGAGGPAMHAHKIEAENHERTNKHPDGREEREGASQAGRILSWYREKGQGTNRSNKWTHGVESITPHTELKPKISFEAGAFSRYFIISVYIWAPIYKEVLMIETITNVGWAIVFMSVAAVIGILLVMGATAVIPRLLDRLTPNLDEDKEIARGNRAVAEYFGRIVSACILGISLVVAAAILGGVIAALH